MFRCHVCGATQAKQEFVAEAFSDIEQVLKEKKPFILHCMPSDLKVMQGRSPVWNRCALNASII